MAKQMLPDVLASALELSNADRLMVENYLRASRLLGLDLDPKSVRKASAEDVRELWGKSQPH